MEDLSVVSSPSSSSETRENISLWTAGCASAYFTDSDVEQDNNHPDASTVTKFNQAMDNLSELAGMDKPSELSFQINDLESANSMQKNECIAKATDACKIICSIIAPNDGDKLFQSLPRETTCDHLLPLVNAFVQAPTRNLRTQILSIYAYELPKKALQKLHEPYGKLSGWQIDRARAHARTCGPGREMKKTKHHRISLNMGKVDHFIDFANRPYFHQDVAFGTRNLKLQNGETIEMPNVVRTVTRSTMVAQYLEFCTEDGFEPLSRATLFRILEVREASQRKSLQGLDNTAADGSTAFSTMEKICERLEHLGVDIKWSQETIKRLEKAKQYLKTDYKVHCQENESPCADHCRAFALSDPAESEFQLNCAHEHTMVCENCDNIKSTLEEIRDKLQENQHLSCTKDVKEELVYDFEESFQNIQKWKSHILRSINQERAKQKVLDNLDESSVLIVMDWAMKFQQTKFREKQSDWYGKRGLSWHVSSVVSKGTSTDTVVVTTYAHLFDSCTQDWFAVASIIENLLSAVKCKFPLVNKAYLRSDEAGCYHNNLLISAVKDIGERVGISVDSYHFSEPQQGKDICDRIISPLKSSIRRYCNEGHDILNAKDMYTALSYHSVKGTSASVNKINESAEELKVKKITNFSSYHNFKYEKDGIRVWKAFEIGEGKKVHDKSIYVHHQGKTQMEVKEQFPDINSVRQTTLKKESTVDGAESEGLFECLEPGCNCVFKSFEDLELHIDVGQHSRFVNNESIYDVLRREWANNFKTLTSKNVQASYKQSGIIVSTISPLEMGWALSQPKTGSVRFSDKVKKYLTAKFDFGERTGHKADPAQVSLDIRGARNEGGERLFPKEEWLNKQQIKGFFSRLAKQRRKGQLDEDKLDENEDYSNCEEEEARETLVNDIFSAINVTHPIYYDAYDLCDMYSKEQLSVFKVPMLKEICKHFDMQFKSRDKKQDLINIISNMIEQCACSQNQ